MSDILTQEQIEELLRSAGQVEAEPPVADLEISKYLTADEQDALGEMGNICMGTSATTMYTLLGKQVTITTPNLSVHTWETLAAAHPLPLVVVEVEYTEGLEGNNLLILKEYDVALITDLLIGGDGNIDPDNIQLDEINLSAIREVMNQMVGSSATSLASMLGRTVNISTPVSKCVSLGNEKLSKDGAQSGVILKISFKMEIEDLLVSELMQVIPIEFAKSIAESLLNPQAEESAMAQSMAAQSAENVHTLKSADYMPEETEAASAPPTPSAPPMQQTPPAAQQPPMQQTPPQQPPMQQQMPQQPMQPPMQPQMPQQPGYPPQGYPYPPYPQQDPYAQQYPQQPGYPPQGYPYQPYPPYPGYPPFPQQFQNSAIRSGSSVDVKEVQYPVFGEQPSSMSPLETDNIRRLLDVPMEVTVELGRTKKAIKDVLDFNIGSVVVLNKQAGEPVEVMINGIQVARGEVVVIDDAYGVRITELNALELSEITKT